MPKDYKSFAKKYNHKSNSNKGQYRNKSFSSNLKNNKTNYPKKKNKTTNNYSNNQSSSSKTFLLKIVYLILGLAFFWVIPLYSFVSYIFSKCFNWLKIRENTINFVIVCLFVVMIGNFFNLQIYSNGGYSAVFTSKQPIARNEIVLSAKGNVYVNNFAQLKDDVPLTGVQQVATVYISPFHLIEVFGGEEKTIPEEKTQEIIELLSSFTNISKDLLTERFEIALKSEYSNLQYFIIMKGREVDQKITDSITNLRSNKDLNSKYRFTAWLNFTMESMRVYPQDKKLASTLGYTKTYYTTADEISGTWGCRDIVTKNLQRGTPSPIGYLGADRGLEQKYCSILTGVNGKKLSAKELTNQSKIRDYQVIDGADIYTTIDANIQRKAEEVLQEAIRKNTNANGSPKDGCIMVIEAVTGNIKAMASYPSFDPNYYSQYYKTNPRSFTNHCTQNDFEPGSIIKPLTVAAALDINENNSDQGVSPFFGMVDYDSKGKPYKNADDTIYIRNAKNMSFQSLGNIGLREIIRDSINTGIGEIMSNIENSTFKEYFVNKFNFGRETNLNLPGDTNGDVRSFDSEIFCDYCYATKAFGQGFSSSILQVARAYSAIANDGVLVEPKLVSKIVCDDDTVETESTDGSCVDEKFRLNRLPSKKIISKNAANNTTAYMLAASEEGYLGEGPTKANVDGYRVAIKSGTAQVSRPIVNPDGSITPCGAVCNTQRGIYDHSLFGFNTGEQKYIVAVKIAEPLPGEVNNFSSATLSPFFSEMMRYTLEYMNVPNQYK